jgi:hypothetical protein
MVMHSGRTDFNPTRSPLVQNVKHMEAIKELIRADRRSDFITMLNFMDREISICFCQSLYKAIKHKLKEREDYIWNLGLSMVAVKGHRAMMFSQTVAGLLVPQFYGGKDVNGGSGKKPDEPNK